METALNIGLAVVGLVPLILVFYVPALLGVAVLKERGEAYRVKAAILFAVGFGAIILAHLMLRSVSALQVVETVGVSLVQISIALALAVFTVYRLAD
ncbi:MAG TPA: hypothetical protein VFJ72_05830 [Rubrobacteraceae bacterium]|nr:hypothetical protein [Rubrobacteraceae bacterium]